MLLRNLKFQQILNLVTQLKEFPLLRLLRRNREKLSENFKTSESINLRFLNSINPHMDFFGKVLKAN